MNLQVFYKIIEIFMKYIVITSLVDIALIGFPIIKLARRLAKSTYMIEKKNHAEEQKNVECSAYSLAYLYRHFDKDMNGSDLYEEMPCKMKKGYVYCRGILLCAKKYGFKSNLYIGNMTALKNTIAKGNPVIVMVRSKVDSKYFHYIPIIGYDNSNFYAVDSIKEFRNSMDNAYNRVILKEEFRKLWNTSILNSLYFLTYL